MLLDQKRWAFFTLRLFTSLYLNIHVENGVRASIQINSSACKEALESGLGRISRSRELCFAARNFVETHFAVSHDLSALQIFMSEPAERAYPMHSERIPARLRSFPPIRAGSLTSAPFCITVHRPGRLPIMSLYSPKDAVYRNYTLDPSFYHFSNHVARSRPYVYV